MSSGHFAKGVKPCQKRKAKRQRYCRHHKPEPSVGTDGGINGNDRHGADQHQNDRPEDLSQVFLPLLH